MTKPILLGVTPHEITVGTGLSAPAVYRALLKLERKGLVAGLTVEPTRRRLSKAGGRQKSYRWLPAGFRSAAQAYEVLIDWKMHELTGGEWKVLLYLCRRTVGFGKPADEVSFSQFVSGIKTLAGRQIEKGTGLDRKTVVGALQELERKGVIVKVRRGTSQAHVWSINWPAVSEVAGVVQERGQQELAAILFT